MTANGMDERLCQAALDGLKTYGLTEFTTRFLERHQVLDPQDPAPRNLDEMWQRIERWIAGRPARCRALWEYVDELRMWGRQRIFLYRADPSYLASLRDPSYIRQKAGERYDEALFRWDADEPFLARVEHTKAPGTGHPVLRLKLIENREYELVVDNRKQTLRERSTNFFVVDLRTGHAELRVQELPTGATRDVKRERDRLMALVGSYLEAERFRPLALRPVMGTLLRAPIYTVTGTRLKLVRPAGESKALPLVALINQLFRRPIPMALNAYRECRQEVVHRKRLHFEINGSIDYVAFGGIADPARVNQVVETLVDVAKRPKYYLERYSKPTVIGPKPGGDKRPKNLADAMLQGVEDQPEVRTFVISAGAVAAAILWILAEAVGSYLLDRTAQAALGGLSVDFLKVALEIAWILFYYGWYRVWGGFKVLLSLPRPAVWRAILEARKRRKELIGRAPAL